MGEKKITAGEYLYREGDVADAVYILQSGKMELLDTEDGVEVQVDIIEPGKTLGELAVFDQKALRPRSARAMEDTVLTSMTSEETRLNAATAMTSERMMNITSFSIASARKKFQCPCSHVVIR